MKTPVRVAVAAAAIAGAGFAGFGLTSALAQEDQSDDAPTTTEAPADDQRGDQGEGRGRGHCAGGPALETMAEAIGIEVDELRSALEEGQTPAEVAEANGVSRGDLVDAVVADINEHLDQAVEDGRLTEEEADERRADVQEHAQAIVDGERPEGFGPPPGPPGGPGAPGEPAPEEEAAGS